MSQFALSKEERESKLWKKLMEHWDDRLELQRIQNEGDKDVVATAKIRGRILELKTNLALDKDLPDIEAPPR